MDCPYCNAENRDDAKFCNECGKKIELVCKECGAVNRAGSKYCDECGYKLEITMESSSVFYSSPKSYVPDHLASKILTTRRSIEGERKLVTVLFADVVGFTGISEKLDPEEVHLLMDGCYQILMDEIHKYEGTITQFSGDGIMALFGAPLALEDHAHRACHTGLSIQKELRSYSDKIKIESGIDFKLRIGINSGLVFVGNIGDDLKMDYTAIGDTINLGSRIEGMAKPGTVLISKNTYNLIENFFEVKSIGEIKVKGKKGLQEAYELVKTGEVGTRLEASIAKGLTRFVGRKHSISIIVDAFDKVKSGMGQVVGLVGEAGVGKSRLLYEIKNILPKEEYSYLEGRCLQYRSSMMYLPIIDIIKSYYNIEEEDNESLVKKKINSKSLELDVNLQNVIIPIQSILSVKIEDKRFIKLEPNEKRDIVFEALRNLFHRLSNNKPLIIAIEDIHWIDKSSEDFLNHFIDSIVNAPIFLMLLYRPEYNHKWDSKSFFTRIGINQLTKTSGIELIEAILNEGKVTAELGKFIFSRSAGNPLFMEELASTLIENGFIEKRGKEYGLAKADTQIDVPSTIQGIISSRIDRLDNELKKVMQFASVVGRNFMYRLLEVITGMRNELKKYLMTLQGLEFIYQKSLFPELEYFFKHAITQEVAYNSLLINKRKLIHEKIGLAIEEIYSIRLEELYELLAYHFYNSDNYLKGAKYSILAAKKAHRNASFIQAIEYTKNCIACIEKQGKDDKLIKQLIDARTRLGLYYIQINLHNEARCAIEPVIKIAEETNYKKRLAQIYTILGANYLYVEEDFKISFEYFMKAISISIEINDAVSLIISNFGLGHGWSYNCEYDKASKLFQKALNKNVDENNLWGISACKSSLSYFAINPQGKIKDGYNLSSQALQLSLKSDDIYSKSFSVPGHGVSCFLKGYLSEAEKYLQDSLELTIKSNLIFQNIVAHIYLGETYYEINDFKSSTEHFEKALNRLAENTLQPSLVKLCNICLTKAMNRINDTKIDLEELIKYQEQNKIKQINGWMKRDIAQILLNLEGNYITESIKWIARAIDADKDNGMLWHLAKDFIVYANISKIDGNSKKYNKYLNIAINMFEECHADGWIDMYRNKLE